MLEDKKFIFDLQLFADGEPGEGDDPALIMPDDDGGDPGEGHPGEGDPTGNLSPGEGDPGEGEPGEGDPDLTPEEKLAQTERNYQRLERKFTRQSQELADARPAQDLYRFMASRPELAEHINQLLELYADTPGIDIPGNAPAQYDPAAERAAMKELLAKPEFVKYEQEISDWAEDNGYPFESAVDQKLVYRLWRGENADRLLADAQLQAKKKASTVQAAKANAGLTRGGSTGNPAPVDYRRMSLKEVLAHDGLSLYTDD